MGRHAKTAQVTDLVERRPPLLRCVAEPDDLVRILARKTVVVRGGGNDLNTRDGATRHVLASVLRFRRLVGRILRGGRVVPGVLLQPCRLRVIPGVRMRMPCRLLLVLLPLHSHRHGHVITMEASVEDGKWQTEWPSETAFAQICAYVYMYIRM